jgi:hypothetical protein
VCFADEPLAVARDGGLIEEPSPWRVASSESAFEPKWMARSICAPEYQHEAAVRAVSCPSAAG